MSIEDEIFENVKKAMQDAEEIGGPEGQAYIALMERIASEALNRIDTYESVLFEKREVHFPKA